MRLCRSEGRDPHYPTVRASIAIARVLAYRGHKASLYDPVYVWACHDILGASAPREPSENADGFIDELIHRNEAERGGRARLARGRNGAPAPHLVGDA